MIRLLYDLLHEWPLDLAVFWIFPLFFASRMIGLGALGIWGRGIPFTNNRDRWGGTSAKTVSWILLVIGYGAFSAFAYWLCIALWRQLIQQH